jgi:hypothetical protein
LEGILTATVEVAGPFKVEGKPLSIRVEPTAYAVKKYARNWLPALGIFLVLIIVAVLVAQRKKRQPNE